MEELIKRAIEKYSSENHRLSISEDEKDLIRWLIKRKADTDGIREAEKYIDGSGLWDDFIDRKLRGEKWT